MRLFRSNFDVLKVSLKDLSHGQEQVFQIKLNN